MNKIPTLALIALCAIAFHSVTAKAGDVDGAGSSFVAPIMAKWADDYAKTSGVNVSYEPIGSGAGIEKIKAGTVDFGATDKPLTPEELQTAGLCQFPVVIGGVVPVVNIPGVPPGEMKLSGKVLALIFMGKVTNWNASEIARDNGGLSLPDLAITVVHRSDGSGTTFNWASYLASSSIAWSTEVGTGLSVPWPVGVGSEGNGGVSASVLQTPGAIGYVEYTYALENNLTYTQVQNHQGLFVAPSADTFQASASTINWNNYKDFSVSIGSAAGGPTAYPIAATTFVLMYKRPKEAARTAAVLAFFKWALEEGGEQASALHYVALPPGLVKRVQIYWETQIQGESSSEAGHVQSGSDTERRAD